MPAHIPLATYRLQLHADFTFKQAQDLVPYLKDLGISHCYSSSVLTAMPGSLHGYDVTDPTSLNPELGTTEEFQGWVRALHAHDMGLILDVVPNHMGIGRAINKWWADVLENGRSSRYARAFDIDWHPIKRELDNKVLLPILADQYGTVLERGDIRLECQEGRFVLRYVDCELPVAPKSWGRILSHRLESFLRDAGEDQQSFAMELQSIITAIRNLPDRDQCGEERIDECYREKEVIRKRLVALLGESPAVRMFLEENIVLYNGRQGEPQSFDLLDELLNEQVYRLASWKVASEEINYRRFFDINELAAIRMEEPSVFTEAHQLIFNLLRDGSVSGLRIDHVDGLYDPRGYLEQLQAWASHTFDRDRQDETPLFVVVEKILGRDEPLPHTWPVHGTTGYEFLNWVNGLFVDGGREQAFTDLYRKFTGRQDAYGDIVYLAKKLIMRASMASEINVLGHQLNLLSERDRRSRDFTLNILTNAIREIIACFPVYRTYVTGGAGAVGERDRAFVHMAAAQAKRRNPTLSGQVFDFVRAILLKQGESRNQEEYEEQIRFVMKFQQTTSPVTAKGIEDTAFYRYNRLISLNEVGGEPQQFGTPVDLFHRRMEERLARWPHALSATGTHDTKRGEDVRARLNALSEMPEEWKARVSRWATINKKYRVDIEGEWVPDANDEYLFYQTLVGAWPLDEMGDEEYRVFCSRIRRYMEKATREAKVHTSWVNPNDGYDQALQRFIDTVLDRTGPNKFLAEFLPFKDAVARVGLWNGLAQVLVKLTAPGVPDFYQGTELWDFSLVDPDNRRPVDYSMRAAMLAELRALPEGDRLEAVRTMVKEMRDGRIKLHLILQAMRLRRSAPDLFQQGDYVALERGGPKRDHVVAFARVRRAHMTVTVVPRLVAQAVIERDPLHPAPSFWADTWVAIPSQRHVAPLRNVLTGTVHLPKDVEGRRVVPAEQLFEACPVALLEEIS